MTSTHIPPNQLNVLWRWWGREQNSRQPRFHTITTKHGMERVDVRNSNIKNTWIDGNFVWGMFLLWKATVSTYTEGLHSKLWKLAGKAHPNIYTRQSPSSSQSRQIVTEISLMQACVGCITNCIYKLSKIAFKFRWNGHVTILWEMGINRLSISHPLYDTENNPQWYLIGSGLWD